MFSCNSLESRIIGLWVNKEIDFSFNFYEDKTYSLIFKNQEIQGKWEINENILTISIDEGKGRFLDNREKSSFEYKIENNILFMNDGKSPILELKKIINPSS